MSAMCAREVVGLLTTSRLTPFTPMPSAVETDEVQRDFIVSLFVKVPTRNLISPYVSDYPVTEVTICVFQE